MLFDLRSRGRRRSVKVVYSGLAILLFIGLVFLGVGGVGGGSFLENVNRGSGGGGRTYAARIAAARKRIAKNPKEAAAWVALTEAQLREAASGEFYEAATGRYTAKGIQQLRRAASSWKSYLALNPSKPDVRLAREVSLIFEPTALNEPSAAVEALQILIAAEPPSYRLYNQLAVESYLASNVRQGDLASKKAIALLPKTKRPLAEAEFEKLKRSIAEQQKSGTNGKTGGAASKGAAATTTTSSTLASLTLTSGTSTRASSSAGKKK